MPLADFTPSTLRTILQQFCETSFNSILITTADPGYPIVYANPRFCEMTGYTLAELEGKSPKLFQGEKTNPKILERLKTAVMVGEPFHGAAINYRKSGESYPVEWNISAIRNEDDEITHYISIQKDLSHLKDLMSVLKRTNEHFREFLLDISHAEKGSHQYAGKQKLIATEVLENTRLYNPVLRSEKNVDLFGEVEFFDCEHNVNGIIASPIHYEKISAKEYNQKYNASLDVQELSNRIRETQEKIDLLHYSKNVKLEFVEIAQNIQDVANDIFYLEEFVEISSTLAELAHQTRDYIKDDVDQMVIETYRGLMTDLEHWLAAMFIRKDADNVHDLDASIISSAKQLLQFLK